MNDDSLPDADTKRPKRRWARWLAGLLVVMLVAGVYGMSLLGTQITAPDWVRQKITQRINSNLNDLSIGLGDVAFVMQEDWSPRLLLRDVQIVDSQGDDLVNLSNVTGTVSLTSLMKGQLQPASIRLSGARVNLRRSADGTVDLSLGEQASRVDRAPSFAALVDDMDRFLQRPVFSSLSRIEAENLTVEFVDIRADRAWTVDGGRLELARNGDDLLIRGDFALLGGGDYATTLEMNYKGRIGRTAADLGLNFQDMRTDDIAGLSPALTWLAALEAPISGALRASVDEKGALGPLNATLQIGAGVLQPTEATTPIAFTSARSYFTYDPRAQSMRFDELSLVSSWVNVTAEGHAYLVDIENGLPRELLAQMKVTQISANPNGLYPAPVTLEGATMDVRLQIDPFLLSLGELSLADQGSHFVLGGELRAEPEGWDLTLAGRMDHLAPDRLLALWPAAFAKGTRSWIVKNVRKANLHNIQMAVRSLPTSKPDVYLGFDFDGLATRFVKGLPEISDGSGTASLLENRFVITAHSGHVTAAQGGRIDVTGTSFIVPNVRVKRGPAQVRLATKSTITAALSLLDEKPFRFLQKANQSVTLADGRARLNGQFDFLLKPKLQPHELAFEVAGDLASVRSETLVPGRVLQAAALRVAATNKSIQVSGSGQLGAVPISGEWRSAIGPGADGTSHVNGRIELSERFTDEFRIGLPPGSISGAGQADISIELAKGAPGRFSLSSDLAGIGISLRQLDWALPQSTRGALIVAGRLGAPPVIDSISLNGAGLSARGRISLSPDGSLDAATFSEVSVGTWLDAPVQLYGRGAGAPPGVRVRGGRIDMRQTSLGGGGSGSGGVTRAQKQKRGGPVSLALDSLQISDGIALTNFRAEFDMSRGVDGNFTGQVNGGTRITGRVVPQNGRNAFRIQSDNAGGVMSSAGLLKQARDGAMDLVLTPAEGKGSYNGRLGIDGFRIKDAPALATLLNAVSVIGILEQLHSNGLHFNRVDARFHLSPDRVTLLEGSATGASLGISMDGYYYMASGQMDMQGVFSPLYLVNAIGGIFNRKGEGLIGFSYTLKGPAKSPRVQVNPLSAFTPGLFREIFRRPAPRVRPPSGATSGAEQQPPAAEPTRREDPGTGARQGQDR